MDEEISMEGIPLNLNKMLWKINQFHENWKTK